MAHVSNLVIDLIEASIGARTAEGVGGSFFQALHPFGATAINARAHPSTDLLAEQVFSRIAPPAFMPVYDEPRFFRDNPLPAEARGRMRPFLWSECRWNGAGALWVRDTMRACGCPDGIIIPCHGPGGYLGVMSLAFADLPGISLAERHAIELAAYVLHGRMHSLAKSPSGLSALTRREVDCLRFVSDGRTNAQIGHAMGLSPATVATHLANARAKLGARTRAQAVAVWLATAIEQ